MTIGTAWTWARARLSLYRVQLRFCLRMTVAALLAFALAQVWNIPLHGLWAVLTAVVVTQMSLGGSLHATTEYVLGTIGGAIYAAAIAVLIPHTTALALAGVLALTIAPLAYAAAVSPRFRVAPFTGAIVLLISGQLGEGPVESALYRLLEVAIGGGVAVAVSLLVLPERAHGLGVDAAARILDLLSRLLLKLLAGFTKSIDVAETTRMQQEAGRALAAFQAIAAEAKGERTGGRPRRRSRRNSPSVSAGRSRAWPNARANICMKAQTRFFSLPTAAAQADGGGGCRLQFGDRCPPQRGADARALDRSG